MSTREVVLMCLGAFGGLIHDLGCYRKSVNQAKLDGAEIPKFDGWCLLLHMIQGTTLGTAAGQMVMR